MCSDVKKGSAGTDSAVGEMMEKAGGMFGNKDLAEKGREKREAAHDQSEY